jgi:hypothetical protein
VRQIKMEEIKFRYVYKSKELDNYEFDFMSIEEIESGKFRKRGLFYFLLSRNLFIGSQDVAGKDIYKGDICDLGGCVCIIDFINNGFYAVSVEEEEKYFGWNPSSIKVIGNIYQNPELLA